MLDLHKSIVQDHIRVAIGILGASNKTHAAVIATDLRLISVVKKAYAPREVAMDEREHRVRERAYFIWIDGRPDGFEEGALEDSGERVSGRGAELKPGEGASLPNSFEPQRDE